MLRPPEPSILVIEDDPAHAELIGRALSEECGERLDFLYDGVAASERLFGLPWSSTPQEGSPALILLDLDLPAVNGQELLRRIRDDWRTCRTPVVVISGRAEPAEVDECYRLGANAVLMKPADCTEFIDMLRTLRRFWIDTVVLPGQ